jgi:hypothetical protein
MPTKLSNQKSIKILKPQESSHRLSGDRITSQHGTEIPPNCIIAPMVVLTTPEPIRKKRSSR